MTEMDKRAEAGAHSELRDRLVAYFRQSCKPTAKRLLGVELEHFVVDRDSLEARLYEGPGGVKELLWRLVKVCPGAVADDPQDFLGFKAPDYVVTLEPAAQLEVSLRTESDIATIQRIYGEFRQRADSVCAEMDCQLLTTGCMPRSKVRDLPLIPRERYRLMDRHFAQVGDGGIEMMRGTASTQISIDFGDEDDFRRKMQAACLLTPLLQLMNDNSYAFEGQPLTHRLKRADIWSRTDGQRCNLVPDVFAPDYGFGDYADYLCRMPIICKERGHHVFEVTEASADEAYRGCELLEADILHVLSMAFPDVRLKGFLEIRGSDSLPEDRMLAYCAFIKGFMYSEDSLDYCQELIAREKIDNATAEEAKRFLARDGWSGLLYGQRTLALREQLLDLAGAHLDSRERQYLELYR